MHACPHCGLEGHQPLLLAAGADADQRALEDLKRQERAAPPELARIIRGLREQLRLERKGARRVAGTLSKIYKELAAWLRTHLEAFPGASVAERAARAGISLETIGQALDELGLGNLRGELFEMQVDSAVISAKVAQASGVAPGVDVAAIGALVQSANARTMLRFWQRDVIESANDLITDGLFGALAGETLDEATEKIAQRLEISAAKAKTQARTAMAGFSRAVAATQAAAVGAEWFRYGGPNDPLARGFCKALVGKVISLEQLSRLNNGQGLPVPTNAGGWNCRHSIGAISKALAEGLGLTFATDEDIDAANRAAAR